jgi:hypothetical protein
MAGGALLPSSVEECTVRDSQTRDATRRNVNCFDGRAVPHRLHLYDDAQRLLDEAKLSFTKKSKYLYMTVDQATVQTNARTFVQIAALVAKTWSKGE